MKYHYPKGHSFFATYRRVIQVVNNPLKVIRENVDRFGDSYTVYGGLRRMILTQDPAFIDYVLKKNHRNYTSPKW